MKGEMCLRLRACDHFWARVRLRTDTIPGFSHLPSPSLFFLDPLPLAATFTGSCTSRHQSGLGALCWSV